MLMRLIYASETTRPLGPSDVEALLTHARRNNARRDLTGMLLFDSRHFLQVLEGGRRVVSDLYSKLAQDPRHQNLLLLACEAIEQRRFNDWDMGFAAADAAHAAVYRRHSAAGKLDPSLLSGSTALALLSDFAREEVSAAAA